ncbi:MAG: hypothetical protein PHE27_02715, partial [Alphaproteobacteria bacterium]|nr:hypothetical protein [Alphaproteobacteria bacterium]
MSDHTKSQTLPSEQAVEKALEAFTPEGFRPMDTVAYAEELLAARKKKIDEKEKIKSDAEKKIADTLAEIKNAAEPLCKDLRRLADRPGALFVISDRLSSADKYYKIDIDRPHKYPDYLTKESWLGYEISFDLNGQAIVRKRYGKKKRFENFSQYIETKRKTLYKKNFRRFAVCGIGFGEVEPD